MVGPAAVRSGSPTPKPYARNLPTERNARLSHETSSAEIPVRRPWRPDRLADTGYAAFGDMVRALLAHYLGTAGDNWHIGGNCDGHKVPGVLVRGYRL